jgi:hypothetical protein
MIIIGDAPLCQMSLGVTAGLCRKRPGCADRDNQERSLDGGDSKLKARDGCKPRISATMPRCTHVRFRDAAWFGWVVYLGRKLPNSHRE